ncbi:MAG: VanZ family protein [Acidobacteriota bacterium]
MNAVIQKVWRRWVVFGLWVAVIFTTATLGNALQSWITRALGDGAIRLAISGVLLAMVGSLAVLARRRPEAFSRGRIGWILALVALTAALVWRLRVLAEPAHLVLYGTLSALAFWALSGHVRDQGIYLAATAIAGIVGILEEAYQWLLPKRYWDLHDITLNVTAAVLVQLLIWRGIRPRHLAAGCSRRSLRLAVALTAVAVALLSASLMNTPPRIDAYAARIPALAFLGQQLSTRMVDYGHAHDDPEIGRFQSRLTLKELEHADRERGAEAAELIRRLGRKDRYHRLQVFYPSHEAPFVFEAGGHLFVRDRYLERSRSHPDAAERRRLATAAFRETLLLERYFPNTLAHLGEGLPVDVRQELAEQHQPEAAFTSEVANWFVTNFSEAQARWALGLSLLGLAVAYRALKP